MTVALEKEKVKRKKIDFVLDASDAKEVFLVGSFNEWSPKKHRMKRNGNGLWRKSLMLLPGTYEYKFWVDGDWREDPGNDRRCVNCFGSLNCIVRVRE